MASILGTAAPGIAVHLAPADGSRDSQSIFSDRAGRFEFSGVLPGWYVLAAGNLVRAVRMQQVSIDVGLLIAPPAIARSAVDPIPIVTVCEALERRDALSYRHAVIVGIFKSGMDETLRLDCPTQLMSGELGWPASIGLTRPAQAPDELRDQVEKKRRQVLASSPPEAPLRPERVVGLYGVFVSLAGLTAARCCSAAVETVLPPARLFGAGETDLSVVR